MSEHSKMQDTQQHKGTNSMVGALRNYMMLCELDLKQDIEKAMRECDQRRKTAEKARQVWVAAEENAEQAQTHLHDLLDELRQSTNKRKQLHA